MNKKHIFLALTGITVASTAIGAYKLIKSISNKVDNLVKHVEHTGIKPNIGTDFSFGPMWGLYSGFSNRSGFDFGNKYKGFKKEHILDM